MKVDDPTRHAKAGAIRGLGSLGDCVASSLSGQMPRAIRAADDGHCREGSCKCNPRWGRRLPLFAGRRTRSVRSVRVVAPARRRSQCPMAPVSETPRRKSGTRGGRTEPDCDTRGKRRAPARYGASGSRPPPPDQPATQTATRPRRHCSSTAAAADNTRPLASARGSIVPGRMARPRQATRPTRSKNGRSGRT